MTSSTLIPSNNTKNYCLQSSTCYSLHDHGRGYRTYSYEFNLFGYEPEQITVLLDKYGKLSIRAYRSPCKRFRRDWYVGGPNLEARLVRNTIDMNGRLRIGVDVRPRQYDVSSITNNYNTINNNSNTNTTLTFDLQGYPSKNVTVRVNESGLLKIHAQHTDDKTEHITKKEYYRQYQLPKHINANQIRARLDENQILTIQLTESLARQNPSWQPYNETNYSLAHGKGPYGDSCCCNVM